MESASNDKELRITLPSSLKTELHKKATIDGKKLSAYCREVLAQNIKNPSNPQFTSTLPDPVFRFFKIAAIVLFTLLLFATLSLLIFVLKYVGWT